MLGGPVHRLGRGVGLVGPQHLKPRQRLVSLVSVGPQVARHRQHRVGAERLVRERGLDKALHPLGDGGGRDSGGQQEAQRIDLTGLKQSLEAPQRRLGLAAAGFGLDHHQLRQVRLAGKGLHVAWWVAEDVVERRVAPAQVGAGGAQIQPHRHQHIAGSLPGNGPAVFVLRPQVVGEKARRGVRPYPVGQRDQAGKRVHQRGLGQQRRCVEHKGLGQDLPHRRSQAGQTLDGLIAIDACGPAWVPSRLVKILLGQRGAMVRDRRQPQRQHRHLAGLAAAPGQHLVHAQGLPPWPEAGIAGKQRRHHGHVAKLV